MPRAAPTTSIVEAPTDPARIPLGPRGGLMKTHTHAPGQANLAAMIGGFQRRDSLRGASPPISGNWKPAAIATNSVHWLQLLASICHLGRGLQFSEFGVSAWAGRGKLVGRSEMAGNVRRAAVFLAVCLAARAAAAIQDGETLHHSELRFVNSSAQEPVCCSNLAFVSSLL